jgi:hypothetical protein
MQLRGAELVAQRGASLCVLPTQCYYRDDEIKEEKMGGDLSNIRENTFKVLVGILDERDCWKT